MCTPSDGPGHTCTMDNETPSKGEVSPFGFKGGSVREQLTAVEVAYQYGFELMIGNERGKSGSKLTARDGTETDPSKHTILVEHVTVWFSDGGSRFPICSSTDLWGIFLQQT